MAPHRKRGAKIIPIAYRHSHPRVAASAETEGAIELHLTKKKAIAQLNADTDTSAKSIAESSRLEKLPVVLLTVGLSLRCPHRPRARLEGVVPRQRIRIRFLRG